MQTSRSIFSGALLSTDEILLNNKQNGVDEEDAKEEECPYVKMTCKNNDPESINAHAREMMNLYERAKCNYIERHESNEGNICDFTFEQFVELAEKGWDPRDVPCCPCNVVGNFYLRETDEMAGSRPMTWGRMPFVLGFLRYAPWHFRRQFNAGMLMSRGAVTVCAHYSPRGGGPHAGSPRRMDTVAGAHFARAHVRRHKKRALVILTGKNEVVPRRPEARNVVLMMNFNGFELNPLLLSSANPTAQYRDNFTGVRIRLLLRRTGSEKAVRIRRRQKEKETGLAVDNTLRMNTMLLFRRTGLFLGARNDDEVDDITMIAGTQILMHSFGVNA